MTSEHPAVAATGAGALAKAVNRVQIIGPTLQRATECEAVLRTLPMWFGIEEALLMYAKDSALLPTFAAVESAGEGEHIVGFICLTQHFVHAWEVHCMAVPAEARNQGVGKALLAHAEGWLLEQGATLLQVKTVADTSSSKAYALTRGFYARMGFVPLEVFPTLWSARNPCLQLVKMLATPAASIRPEL